MTVIAAMRRAYVGPKKIAVVGAALALSALAVGIWTRGGLLVASFLLIASCGAALGIVAMQRRRRSQAEARDDQRRARQEYFDNIATHLDLDRWLIADLELADGSRPASVPTVVRTPMTPGKKSHFLNRVSVVEPGGATVDLVEKGVDSDSNEFQFWRHEYRPKFTLCADRFRSLEPVSASPGDSLSVMYFPYVPALDREQNVLRRTFRADMKTLVTAVADFNGRNMVARPEGNPSPFVPTRPTIGSLELRLNVSTSAAQALRDSWDEVYDAWEVVSAAYERLPWCLCHNDVSPGNAVHMDGTTTLTDFGLAGVGPVGSDLHTFIRWSHKAIHDEDHVEGLLKTYVDGIRTYDRAITMDDVRLSAWSTFFLRYTNLKFSSARYPHAFSLALRRMNEIIGQIA